MKAREGARSGEPGIEVFHLCNPSFCCRAIFACLLLSCSSLVPVPLFLSHSCLEYSLVLNAGMVPPRLSPWAAVHNELSHARSGQGIREAPKVVALPPGKAPAASKENTPPSSSTKLDHPGSVVKSPQPERDAAHLVRRCTFLSLNALTPCGSRCP